MARKRQFFGYGKNAYAHALLALEGALARQNKSGFGKVSFPRERLHFSVAQSVAVEKNRERISFQRLRAKHIHMNHRKTAFRLRHGHSHLEVELLQSGAGGRAPFHWTHVWVPGRTYFWARSRPAASLTLTLAAAYPKYRYAPTFHARTGVL